MHRILLSLAMVVFAGGLVMGGTGAFFSDEETSTGNVFAAGALDLKVDSEAHYNGMICTEVGDSVIPVYEWHAGPDFQNLDANVPLDHYPQPGTPCEGTWTETDLGPTLKFFNLSDIKPGDEGENTISLHVYDNDAWGRFVIDNVQDLDNDCSEPEEESLLDLCTVLIPEGTASSSGELAENITFHAWLDQGAIPGFQNIQPNGGTTSEDYIDTQEDPTEGDNIWQGTSSEPIIITAGTVDEVGEIHNIWPALQAVRANTPACAATPATGHNNYDLCHGLADDGRMVGSVTYYFGLAWNVPTTVGNEAQSDSLSADLTFEVEQQRNNDNPFQPSI